jgi:acetyl esterase/lipase
LAKDAGVSVTIKVWDDMVHVWQAFAAILPEAQQSIDEAGEFIRNHIGGSG